MAPNPIIDRRRAAWQLCFFALVLTALLWAYTGHSLPFAGALAVVLIYRHVRVLATCTAPVVPAYTDQPLAEYQALVEQRQLEAEAPAQSPPADIAAAYARYCEACDDA